jgi:hypothetical protein
MLVFFYFCAFVFIILICLVYYVAHPSELGDRDSSSSDKPKNAPQDQPFPALPNQTPPSLESPKLEEAFSALSYFYQKLQDELVRLSK